jgi:NAD(P)-dependent dehydrogenase (short-subunit alcohol dehydrogenase family)
MKITSETRAVVTGAGSGFGREFVLELLRRGARVLACDLRAEAVEETVAAAGPASPQRAWATACDVRDEAAVAALAERARELMGGTDLLINNAGVGSAGDFGAGSLDPWRHTIDVNLWGVIHGCHYFVPEMRKRRGGHVLNVASAAGLLCAPGMGPYNISKAGVVAISETLAGEASEDGLGVTVLCPGFVKTAIMDNSIGEVDESRRKLAEAEMERSKVSAADVARIALDAVENNELYCLPHGEIRWAWRLQRLAPAFFRRGIVQSIRRRQVKG